MRVIVTRPEREAGQWVQRLGRHGVDAVALPLIAIAPAGDSEPLRDAWRRLMDLTALMFVSGNAVDHFFSQKVAAGGCTEWLHPIVKTRAWAAGPATRDALAAAGVDPALIDAPAVDASQFDSEALWHRVGDQVQPGDRVLIVRGGDSAGNVAGRNWLALQLEAAGAQVEAVVAYVRQVPGWDARQLTRAREAADDGSVWLFSSSEAIGNLARLLPGQGWGRARALATHPRIAQAARTAGFGVVCESLPSVDAIGAALESIR